MKEGRSDYDVRAEKVKDGGNRRRIAYHGFMAKKRRKKKERENES